MKKSFLVPGFVFACWIFNCSLIDSTGLVDTVYKGSEAKEKIRNAAYVADLSFYTAAYGDSAVAASVALYGSIIDSFVVKIDDSKYYKKDDVNACTTDIRRFGASFIADSLGTLILSSNCNNMKPDGLLTTD
ncbi:TIGR04452 family lipoprotein [Leptospira johnsonii]|uniref:Lipoprotein n=1 Tax=Leptospira johnsonii TaxID=1917820 RepID=A0A2P2D199_9LEPT|nr:TIGR04452 family lipoprotein [Leptospira johnsonii]GBF38422.1 hypothetical protein LPTSP1_14130 [Leptospira johnsonii]